MILTALEKYVYFYLYMDIVHMKKKRKGEKSVLSSTEKRGAF